jgi:hypothetical protein
MLRHRGTSPWHNGRLESDEAARFSDSEIGNPARERGHEFQRDKTIFKNHTLEVISKRPGDISDQENPGKQ